MFVHTFDAPSLRREVNSSGSAVECFWLDASPKVCYTKTSLSSLFAGLRWSRMKSED